jgi:hypothetical protein
MNEREAFPRRREDYIEREIRAAEMREKAKAAAKARARKQKNILVSYYTIVVNNIHESLRQNYTNTAVATSHKSLKDEITQLTQLYEQKNFKEINTQFNELFGKWDEADTTNTNLIMFLCDTNFKPNTQSRETLDVVDSIRKGSISNPMSKYITACKNNTTCMTLEEERLLTWYNALEPDEKDFLRDHYKSSTDCYISNNYTGFNRTKKKKMDVMKAEAEAKAKAEAEAKAKAEAKANAKAKAEAEAEAEAVSGGGMREERNRLKQYKQSILEAKRDYARRVHAFRTGAVKSA